MPLARNESSFSFFSARLACCALQSPSSGLARSVVFTPLTCLRMEPRAVVPSLFGAENHRCSVSGCVLSQSYLSVVVRLEDRCFPPPSPHLLFFFKEKHTHLPELGVLLTAEQCDGCARASFHQNIKPWGWLLPFILVI